MAQNYDDDFADREDEFDDRGGGRIEQAKAQVSLPGILLILLGVFSLLAGALNLAQMGSFSKDWDEQLANIDSDPKYTPEQRKDIHDMVDPWKEPVRKGIPVAAGLQCIIGLIAVFGGIQMRNLKGRGLAYMGALLSMIPCASGCCILGVPFGIWIIIVLGRPTVKAGFADMARRGL